MGIKRLRKKLFNIFDTNVFDDHIKNIFLEVSTLQTWVRNGFCTKRLFTHDIIPFRFCLYRKSELQGIEKHI